MAAKKKKEWKKILTPEFRVSFPQVYKASAFGNNKTPKFKITMLFDDDADLTEMRAEAKKAAVNMYGPKEDWPENFRWPFRKGDKKKDLDGYAGKIFVTASTTQRPGLVDKHGKEITKESGKFYAGCFAVATLVCSAFDKDGGKGVTFYLNNIKKTRDGEEFSSRTKAEDDFEFEEGSDDDEEDQDAEGEDGDEDSDSAW